ncbi:hypothetical protein GQ53DRAFT_721540 [Thozetella sp. PMI_491]|nr:hypothetical protein GQ53DRAFT_721540 [Thozetella sp. PMI_491]
MRFGLPPTTGLSRCVGPHRRKWPIYLLAAVLLLFSLNHFVFPEPTDLSALVPAQFQSKPLPPIAQWLRPGAFVDPSRQRMVPDKSGDPPADEPNGKGTMHDERNDKFYAGGITTLTTQDHGRVVYDPYPEYNSAEWHEEWRGDFQACQGPRGKILDRKKVDDTMLVYRGNQKDFPFPMFGSHEALGLDPNVCTDRCSRYRAYGYAENKASEACPKLRQPSWDNVNWGRLQNQCAEQNSNRYKIETHTTHPTLLRPSSWTDRPDWDSQPPSSSAAPRRHPRTAIIIRSWHSMNWASNHRQYLRSLIMELSLHSGAEYQVFLLVDVKTPLVFSDKSAIRRLKDEFIPREFHDITVLFSESLLEEWYPNNEDHRYPTSSPWELRLVSPNFQHLQPIQIFAQLHPQFDFYWQFEMDSRNFGHAYQFLDRAVQFARQQPRKYLWERSAYFYLPGAYGSWEQFVQMVDKSMVGRETSSVWGPVSAPGVEPVGPQPPTPSPEDDEYQWGIGEEADLITLLPIFDAPRTNWTYPDKIWGVPKDLPRRASPVTMWRMSRQLLGVMHEHQNRGMAVVSEMSGPTWALLHGLKAVAVPHPIFVDGLWSAHELAPIMNRGEPERVNGGTDSLWNWDHSWDHILFRMTYMFTTQTAEDLFRRYLGYPADPDQYTDGSLHRDPQNRFWYDEGKLDETKYGHLCFPAMFLHTIKNVAAEKGKDMAVPV